MTLRHLAAAAGLLLVVACSPSPPTPTAPPPPATVIPAPPKVLAQPSAPAPPPTKPSGAAKPAAADAKPAAKPSGGSGCPFASKADASAALGKDVLEGQPEGSEKCFFAAADSRTAPASEYVDVGVNQHNSPDDAKILFEATRGRPGAEPIGGLGDAAVYVKEADGGQVLVVKGKATVFVGVVSKAQSDPKGALKKLATAVLAKA